MSRVVVGVERLECVFSCGSGGEADIGVLIGAATMSACVFSLSLPGRFR
jgi:hypothetical protein